MLGIRLGLGYGMLSRVLSQNSDGAHSITCYRMGIGHNNILFTVTDAYQLKKKFNS